MLMRVLHVVAQLGTYGAERLVGLLLAQNRTADIEQAALTVSTSTPEAVAALKGLPVFDAARAHRYDFAFLPRMVGLIRRYKPDIVHTHTHVGKYFGRLAAIFAGVPIIVHTEHNGFFGAPSLFRLLNRALISYTDVVVAFSPSHRDYLTREERISPKRIVIIPNGVPPCEVVSERTRAVARANFGVSDERVLLNIARFAPAKNQSLAVEALALLDERHHLIFIGDGADRAAVERLSLERGLAERVMFLGYRNDATALMAGADTIVVTSKIEGMPLTVMEAMLTGIPVVSTPWRGASEMLGDGSYGIISPNYTADYLATALRNALDEPSATQARSERALSFARTEFDVATMVSRHAELYRALNSGTSSARRRITAARS
jgi:glycosyltransferase involved in cell wall biosynthesis